MSQSPKTRLDQILENRGLAASRSKAQALVLSGEVYVDGERSDKPGKRFDETVDIEIRSSRDDFVSRGGHKLSGALDHFALDVTGNIVLDVGSSTGGFTDCLLRRGAAKVYAVDVGRGQLDWSLRNDERVVVLEGVNARYLEPVQVADPIDLVVMDVSFISVTKILPAVIPLVKPGGLLLPMIKPQFEVGRDQVGKGGVIRDRNLHEQVLRRIVAFLRQAGTGVIGIGRSQLPGPKGNREFFILSRIGGSGEPEAGVEADITRAVNG